MEKTFKNKEEMVEYFKGLAQYYISSAQLGGEGSEYLQGKGKAFEIAAHELEHNMK